LARTWANELKHRGIRVNALAPCGPASPRRYRDGYQTGYREGMPALNVEFSPDEMARLRERATLAGKSLKQHVHDVTVQEADRIAFVEGAIAEAERILPGVTDRFPAGLR